jgi:hypothetical protein
MDFKLVSGVLGLLCLVLAAYALLGGGVRTETVVAQCPLQGNLSAYYLYPLRCVNCDLNAPGQCDYCTGYYDERTIGLVGADVGVPLQFKLSDAVNVPGVFVVSGGKATLGDGRTRYNIAQTLCQFAGVKESCDYFHGQRDRMLACVAGYNLAPGTVVYHTGGKDCTACSKADSIVAELKGLQYNDTVGYGVFVADRSKPQGAKIVSDCMQFFDAKTYVPQLLCPATGRDLGGDFTLSQAREFADRCIESS